MDSLVQHNRTARTIDECMLKSETIRQHFRNNLRMHVSATLLQEFILRYKSSYNVTDWCSFKQIELLTNRGNYGT